MQQMSVVLELKRADIPANVLHASFSELPSKNAQTRNAHALEDGALLVTESNSDGLPV
jgi:hypothetical protein